MAVAGGRPWQVPLCVLCCDCLISTACGARASAPEHATVRDSAGGLEIFFFTEPAGCGRGQLLLAPTGAGKSTWRKLAPFYCHLAEARGRLRRGPEGEVMADVTFHPSYHKCLAVCRIHETTF